MATSEGQTISLDPKKIGPTASLEVGKRSALAIVKEEALVPTQKKASPYKREREG